MQRFAVAAALCLLTLTACGPDLAGPTSSAGDIADGDGDVEGDGDPSGDGDGEAEGDGDGDEVPMDLPVIPDMGSGETGGEVEQCCSCVEVLCFEVPVGTCANPQTGAPDPGWQGCDGSEADCLSSCACTCNCDLGGASAGCDEAEASACNAGCGF